MRCAKGLAASVLLLMVASPVGAQGPVANDYPTLARADYVLGCWVANNQTREALERCSCSIDVIATLLPHERYVEAETILSVGQRVGQAQELFRGSAKFRDVVADLRRAQAEAEVQCFP